MTSALWAELELKLALTLNGTRFSWSARRGKRGTVSLHGWKEPDKWVLILRLGFRHDRVHVGSTGGILGLAGAVPSFRPCSERGAGAPGVGGLGAHCHLSPLSYLLSPDSSLLSPVTALPLFSDRCSASCPPSRDLVFCPSQTACAPHQSLCVYSDIRVHPLLRAPPPPPAWTPAVAAPVPSHEALRGCRCLCRLLVSWSSSPADLGWNQPH